MQNTDAKYKCKIQNTNEKKTNAKKNNCKRQIQKTNAKDKFKVIVSNEDIDAIEHSNLDIKPIHEKNPEDNLHLIHGNPMDIRPLYGPN